MTAVPEAPVVTDETSAKHIAVGSRLENARKVFLEDLDFSASPDPTVDAWAKKLAAWLFSVPSDQPWQEAFKQRFLVVHDSIFDFLCETGTEVATRVCLDDELKTVKKGQLWNEEALPAETILSGLISCDRVYEKDPAGPPVAPATLLRKYATGELNLQLGGKATTGRGHVRCVFTQIAGAN
jgi:CRISPR-associated protein Cmr4